MPAPVLANLPNGRKMYFQSNGIPLAGGSVAFYVPGTTTFSPTYTDIGQSIANPNPIILDAGGSCVAFGVGQFREYVLDALGNVISDSIVVGSTPLTISAAMLPVLQAPTVAAAEALLLAGNSTSGQTTHLNLNVADQTLTVAPTANPPATLASLNVQGPTISANGREFLVNLGLTSATGQGGTAGNDKVTLYSGLQANAGSADVWTLNTCLTMGATSGSYSAQGIELDFNNLNANRGQSGTLLTDFAAPIANGLSITGSGSFSSTTGLSVNSQGPGPQPQWNRGITTLGTMGICAIQDWSTAPVGLQFDGAYSVAAINLTSVYGNAGGVTTTGLLLKNAQQITWQNATATAVMSDFVDVANNRYVGLSSAGFGHPGGTGGVIMGASTIPQVTNTMNLGNATNRWGDTYVSNLRLPNAQVVSWDNNPDNNGGVSGFIFDYADALNNRVVGGGSKVIYLAADTAPITPGMVLGTPANFWGAIYGSTGVTAPSDLRLKRNVEPLPPVLDLINKITPISFKWIDPDVDVKTHYGFNAADIRDNFPNDFAGFEQIDDTQWLNKDELIAVLWQGLRELNAKVERLSTT